MCLRVLFVPWAPAMEEEVSSSAGSRPASAAYVPLHQTVAATPSKQRVFGFGDCTCDRSRLLPPRARKPGQQQVDPPWAHRGINCRCRKVRGAEPLWRVILHHKPCFYIA